MASKLVCTMTNQFPPLASGCARSSSNQTNPAAFAAAASFSAKTAKTTATARIAIYIGTSRLNGLWTTGYMLKLLGTDDVTVTRTAEGVLIETDDEILELLLEDVEQLALG